MKNLISFLIISLFVSAAVGLNAQSLEGTVSYTSSQRVYVKFQSTETIQAGDTLYLKAENGNQLAALIVENKSSISCVCTNISNVVFKVGDKVFHSAERENIDLIAPDTLQLNDVLINTPVPKAANIDTVSAEEIKAEGRVRGRLSLASYTTVNSENSTVLQRMRYTLAFKADQIDGTAFSAETYITFSHRNNRWDEIREDLFNGLKIYALVLNYRFSPAHQLYFGRKINPNIAQLGVNDGLQYEFKHRNFSIGLIAGSRPDQQNFSLNTGLFQTGSYFSHSVRKGKKSIQSSVAIVEQTNKGNTDRRFVYFQHSNNLLKGLYFFGSLEFDLFKKQNDIQINQFSLSNSYLSLRYRPYQKLSFSLSYSSRQAIIYYETYKTIVDQLLEQASTQGVNFQTDFRPFKGMIVGFRAGYRNNDNNARETKNLHTYLHITRIPWLQLASSVSATLIATPYIDGSIYSISFYKDFLRGRLNTNLSYRYVDYLYLSGEFNQIQHMAELGLGYRLFGKLFVNLNTEHSFEKTLTAHRVYFSITQRF